MTDFLYDDDREALDEVESLVRAACGYVQPTDDLRPRTLEAAREACRQRRSNRRLGGLALSVVLLAVCGFPHWGAAPDKQVADASAVIRHFDIDAEASLRASGAGFGPAWAFFEAFSDLRRMQADLFESAM
jgi:hypothetical protein